MLHQHIQRDGRAKLEQGKLTRDSSGMASPTARGGIGGGRQRRNQNRPSESAAGVEATRLGRGSGELAVACSCCAQGRPRSNNTRESGGSRQGSRRRSAGGAGVQMASGKRRIRRWRRRWRVGKDGDGRASQPREVALGAAPGEERRKVGGSINRWKERWGGEDARATKRAGRGKARVAWGMSSNGRW